MIYLYFMPISDWHIVNQTVAKAQLINQYIVIYSICIRKNQADKPGC